MKKVLVAIALVMGLGSSVVFAQEVKKEAVETKAQTPQDGLVKIDAKEIPDTVMNALAKNYAGASIKEVFVEKKDTGKEYKVVITTKDAQAVTVLINEKGEEVKAKEEEPMK